MIFHKALITGASSGIGEAIAKLLANEKIPLILSGRNVEKLNQLKEELKTKVPVEVVVADLGEAEGVRSLIEVIRTKQPDLLINNAGYGAYGEAISYPIEESLKMVQVDVSAVLELTLEAAKTLITQNKRGTILNVSSAAGFQTFPNFAVYSASKAFLNRLSPSLDFELAPKGVRVLVACPGKVRTGFSKRASPGQKEAPIDNLTMDREFVAQEIWDQIKKGKQLNIINWKYKLLTLFSYLLPTKWVAESLGKEVKARLST